MLIKQNVGIISYGACLPDYAIPLIEIEQAQKKKQGTVSKALGVEQKTVPGLDEDTVTLSVDASYQALSRLNNNGDQVKNKKNNIQALFIGSESHPYAVKPSGTVVKEALGLDSKMSMVDMQFACKAGTAALQIANNYVLAGSVKEVLAIGADTAQAAPGDALEFTASAGAAAFVVGKRGVLAKILATSSFATDTPDFWRRPKQSYPQHAGRFTGGPAYFHHIVSATKNLMAEAKVEVKDIDYCVFHTPNAKFPKAVAKMLGFTPAQLKYSLPVEKIGNTYAAASLIALVNVLDKAKAGEKILVTSYGSGAGADSFLLEVTPLLEKKRKTWQSFLDQQIKNLKLINYQTYLERIKSH